SPTGVTVSVPPEQSPTAATPGALDAQPNARSSPLGSVNTAVRSTTNGSSPSASETSGIGSATTGGGFVTVTTNTSSALASSGSLAVTVTVASPALSGVTVSVLPAHATEATPGALDAHP